MAPFCVHELDIFWEQLNSGTLRHCEKSTGLYIVKEIHLFVQSQAKKSFFPSKVTRRTVSFCPNLDENCEFANMLRNDFFFANLVTFMHNALFFASLANVHDKRFEGILPSVSETLPCTKNPAF